MDALRLDLTRKVTATANRTARDWEARLKRTGPTDTGRMRDATTSKVSGRAGSILIETKVDVPYAAILRRGQRPHVITPAHNRFLYNARTGFAARSPVNHPGTQPNNWWDDAIRDLPDLIMRNWRAS